VSVVPRVSIGGFVADITAYPRITCTLKGWTDGAPVAPGMVDKAQQDGGWDGTGFLRPRAVTLSGDVLAASRADALSVADELTSLIPQASYQLTVEDDPAVGARSAMVRVTTAPVMSWRSAVSFAYEVTVTAPDPLKYGAPTFASTTLAVTGGGTGLTYPLAYPLDYGQVPGVIPGAVSLANDGTAAYWPRLRIDGPVPNPTISLVETGDWVHFEGTVGAGQWLDIDCANRRVLLNGQVSVRAAVSSSGSWLAVPPGGGSVSWTADAADPAATLSVWGYQGAWT
jgi:Phage tail protein